MCLCVILLELGFVVWSNFHLIGLHTTYFFTRCTKCNRIYNPFSVTLIFEIVYFVFIDSRRSIVNHSIFTPFATCLYLRTYGLYEEWWPFATNTIFSSYTVICDAYMINMEYNMEWMMMKKCLDFADRLFYMQPLCS